MTEVAKEALNLDELKALCAELCDLYDKWAVGNQHGYGLDAREAARCMELAAEISRRVPALVAEVERLRAKQADVERIVDSVNQFYPASQASLHDALRDLSRVLSRTEDGTNG